MKFLSHKTGLLLGLVYLVLGLNLPATAGLQVEPVSFSESVICQGALDDQLLALQNITGHTQIVYDVSVTAGTAWLSLTGATNGTNDPGETATISVVFSPSALPEGQHSGTISIGHVLINTNTSAQTVGPAREVPVVLKVNPKPQLRVSTTVISNVVSEGRDAPSRSFQVWNGSGSYELHYTIDNNAPWVLLSSGSGVSTGEYNLVTLEYSTAGLDVGVYTGTVTVTAQPPVSPPATAGIDLRLEVTGLAGLGCDGSDVSWLLRLGDPAFSWDFEVWNSSSGSDTSLRWQAAVLDDVSWLAVTPATGVLGKYQTEMVTVTCDPAGLSPGNYQAVLQVSGVDVATGQAAANSPVEIRVELVLRPGDGLDFGGLGRSAMVVYGLDNGVWGLRDLFGGYAWDWLGDRDYLPVPGDYTGNGKADLAVYRPASGNWYWKALDSANIYLLGAWGGPGFQPVAGDFDGDGRQDFVLYNESAGAWYALLSGSGYSQPVTAQLGGPGYLAVNGDFDGDGLADPAVYHAASGRWQALLSGLNYQRAEGYFGGSGFTALTGDFDGDGRTDLCIYHESGRWFILTVENRWLLSGAWWGGDGYQPLIGDFDGNGVDDLAVYETATGYWRIRSMDGAILAWDLPWGGYGYAPVSR